MKNGWLNAEELRWAARHWATTMGLEVSGIRNMPLKRKWGSMSTRGWMTLNSELIDLPRELLEYVIVHELVHQLAPNHGRVFRAFLTSYRPDWERRHGLLQLHSMGDRTGTADKQELSHGQERTTEPHFTRMSETR